MTEFTDDEKRVIAEANLILEVSRAAEAAVDAGMTREEFLEAFRKIYDEEAAKRGKRHP